MTQASGSRTTASRKLGLGLALVIAVLVAGALAAPAGAVVTGTATGKHLSYMPLNGEGPSASPFAANGNLDYHGGPVMPSVNAYAIFWAPSGFSFPAGYEAAVNKYLQDVAADSGNATNTLSVGAQYTDTTPARSNYSVTFGGSFDDTTAYPVSGCPPYSGLVGAAFTTCLTDAQLAAEVNAFVTAHSLTRGFTTQYLVFFPDGVGTCFTSTGTADPNGGCFDAQYCAYHSHTPSNPSSTPQTIYANEGFTPRDPSHCGNHNYPNGHANGNVDDQLSTLSHEMNEAREDPLLNAWWNSNTHNEGADQCRNTTDDYGPLLGGTNGTDGYNQVINGSHYILQQDWSNANVHCEQHWLLSATMTAPSSATTGQSVSFGGTATDGSGGTVSSFDWDFGDGTTATGATQSHSFAAPGTYTVKLTATNNVGLKASTTQQITVTNPPRTLTVTVGGSGSGTVTGTGISCPGDCTETYADGTAVTLTATPNGSDTFSGWGGACSGTGTCSLTMDADKGATATFAPAPPPNDITFGKPKLNKNNGTAVLPVTVPGDGNLTLGGNGIKPITKARQAKAVHAGITKLKVKAQGKKAKQLKKRGKVKVKAKVTFTPIGGSANTEVKKLKLVRKKR